MVVKQMTFITCEYGCNKLESVKTSRKGNSMIRLKIPENYMGVTRHGDYLNLRTTTGDMVLKLHGDYEECTLAVTTDFRIIVKLK